MMREPGCGREGNPNRGGSAGNSSWWCEAPTVVQSVVRGVERMLGDVEDDLRRLVGRRGLMTSVKMVDKDQ